MQNEQMALYPKCKLEEKLIDQRSLSRIPIRENEGISAFMNVAGNAKSYRLRVIDISSIGFCVETELPLDFCLSEGDCLDFTFTYRHDNFRFNCTVCHMIKLKQGRVRLGLLRTSHPKGQKLFPYPGDSISLPATTHHSFYYNEDVALQITGISYTDLIVECDDSDFLIFPSMPIKLALSTASDRHDKIKGVITWIEAPGNGKTRFGVQIEQMSDKSEQIIVRQLIQQHDWSPRELKAMGFACKQCRPLIKFRSLHTHNEYMEVLKLRRQAYISVNKIDPNCSAKDLSSELDRKSRIIVAYHHSRLVGTVALLFPDSEDMILDTEKTFTHGYPVKLPPKTKMIEIARLCINSDYRATDILWGMFEHVYRIMITSGRDYIISSTDDHMWPLYKIMGFKKVGITYAHPMLKGIKHHIILINKNTPLFGQGTSPFLWNKIYRNMTDYLTAIDAVDLNAYQRARISLNKILFAIFCKYLKLNHP